MPNIEVYLLVLIIGRLILLSYIAKLNTPSETADQIPLPLSRMVTINSTSFWVFIGACIVLFIYSYIAIPDTGNDIKHLAKTNYIGLTAFVGLFLNLVTSTVKNKRISRLLNICCYVFEIVGIIVLTLLLTGK